MLVALALSGCSGDSSNDGTSGGGGAGATVTSADSIRAKCQARFDHYEAACQSDLYGEPDVALCERLYLVYRPIGCEAAYDAFVLCAANATVDCGDGPAIVECTDESNAYFACDSQFTFRTGCTRLGLDDRCSDSLPYFFDCRGSLPAGCVPTPASDDDAAYSCCPDLSE